MGKKYKKILSENIRPTVYILSVYQCSVVPYIIPANKVPGVESGPAPGIKSIHELIMRKTL